MFEKRILRKWLPSEYILPWWLVVKNPPASAGDIRDAGLIPGSGRSPGGRHGNPLQDTCPENPIDRGAWQATVHEIAKSWTGTVGALSVTVRPSDPHPHPRG